MITTTVLFNILFSVVFQQALTVPDLEGLKRIYQTVASWVNHTKARVATAAF